MRTRPWRRARVLLLVITRCWTIAGCHLFPSPVIVTTPGFLGPADFSGSYDKPGKRRPGPVAN